MLRNVTRDLFAEIQKLIPGLPDSITHLELKMNADSAPVVTCQYLVKTSGTLTEERKVFDLVERNAVDDPPPPVTKIG